MNNGAFGENFPYSNFHDLNMDWIIKIAKDFLDQYTNIQQTITDGLEDLDTKATELEALLQQWYDSHSEDIANQLADALNDLNDWYNDHIGDLNQALQTAITNFNNQAEAKGTQVIASIPSDYTLLNNEVRFTPIICYAYGEWNFDDDNNMFNIKAPSVLVIKDPTLDNEYVLSNKTLSVNPILDSDLFAVLYNIASDSLVLIRASTMSHNTLPGNYLVAFMRRTTMKIWSAVDHARNDMPICGIIPGSNGIITFNTTNKTITFPNDTIIYDPSGNNGRIILNSPNNVCDYSNMTGSAIYVVYDVVQSKLIALNWATPVRASQFIVCMFRTNGQVSITAPYLWNNKLFNMDVNSFFTGCLFANFDLGTINQGMDGISFSRLRTKNTINNPRECLLYWDDSRFRTYVHYYDSNGNYTSSGGWYNTSPKTIEANSHFRIVYAYKTNEHDLTNDEITDMVLSFSIRDAMGNTFYDNSLTHKMIADNQDQIEKLTNKTMKAFVEGYAHRGTSASYPENTMIAFKNAVNREFTGVETDVRFTSDNIPVLIHDATIDRTSDGTGNVADMTLQQLRQYDFGSWKGAIYAGQQIPTLEDLLKYAKNVGCAILLELKSGPDLTNSQLAIVYNMVKKYGMLKHVRFISFIKSYLTYLHSIDPQAMLGLLTDEVTTSDVTFAVSVSTDNNRCLMDSKFQTVTQAICDMCITNNLPLGIWTPGITDIISANPYTTVFTSDGANAPRILYESEA